MMNNPIMQLMNVMRGGGNLMQMMQQMARSNPQIAQVMQVSEPRISQIHANALRKMRLFLKKDLDI